jgi:hypothetical protein
MIDYNPTDPATPAGYGQALKVHALVLGNDAPRPTVRIRKLYEFSEGPRTVEFVPVENVPGFSHRVIVDGKPSSWLSSDYKPSEKSARYFWGLAVTA